MKSGKRSPTAHRTLEQSRQHYRDYQGTPEQIANRAKRNQARKEAGLKKGDPREAAHKKPLSKGGSNAKSNVHVTSRKANRQKGNKT